MLLLEGKYFPSSKLKSQNLIRPLLSSSLAFRGGNLNYDLEFLVIAWFVQKYADTDPANKRRALFNFGADDSTSNLFQFKVCKKKVMVQGGDGGMVVLNPCQKPWRLIQRFIEYFTLPDDTVLDLCSGTGTTALACLLTNRNCISIESDEVQFLLLPTRLTQAQSRVRSVIHDETHRAELDKDEEL